MVSSSQRILEQETLDSQWDPCLVLDLGIDIFNPVGGLDLEHEALASNVILMTIFICRSELDL